ncbi:MAG TPA: hypothetical protein VGN23_14170 [Verrucomicrobiae bacterium]|jgi:hypothetical protein
MNRQLRHPMNKNLFFRLLPVCFGLAMLFTAGKISAQVIASDSAAPYAGWQTGTNYGFGFQPWIQVQSGTHNGNSFTGYFLGNSGDPVASTNGQAWGMYANGGSGTNVSEAFRGFSNSLPVNATFSIKWHNDGVGNSITNACGFSLRNGNSTNLMNVTDYFVNFDDGARFAFYYLAGISDNFYVYDGNGISTIPLGFSKNPFQVEFTLLPGGTYNLTVLNAAGTQVLWSSDSQPLAGGAGSTIDSAALYAFQTAGDQVFNNMQIFDLPPQIEDLTPTNNSVFVPNDVPFSFAAVSQASIISSNNIQMTLNGMPITGPNWTVIGSGTASNEVVVNVPLQLNQVYTGTIIAADANGNTATNNFTFNTWVTSPNNIYIESSDYNFGGGYWINNFTFGQPNQDYAGLFGTNDVDYLIFNPAGTNNAYRPGDLPALQDATDVDHDGFANNGFQQYNLSYVQNGEWLDYTRQLSNNVTYAVYARMAGFGANPTMLLERLAAPLVASTNQPRSALGTFVCPQTGGVQDWTFVPLTDFFSNPVQINSGGTNTFRITDIGGNGSYNLNYLILVATTNTATLRPYIASGFPYPGLTGVAPDQTISFAIANRQTSVSTVQAWLNSSNISSALVFNNTAAGTGVSYQPSPYLTAGMNTLQVVINDGTVSTTNTWQFSVQTLPTIPPSYALAPGSLTARGFTLQVAKAPDGSTNIDFPATVARAVAQLNGTLTNSQTGQPYSNVALDNGNYTESNTIDYEIDSSFTPPFFTSPTPATLPDLPVGTTNDVAMAATMYVQLSAGIYAFAVTSDDGFMFTTGATPASTNLTLGIFNGGRAAGETAFTFIVQTNGLYPMQLIFFKSQFTGGGVQLYSIDRTSGIRILLNDTNNVNSIPVYQALTTVLPIPLTFQRSGTNLVFLWGNPAFSLQSAPQVTGTYTNMSGATSPYTNQINGGQQFFRLVH